MTTCRGWTPGGDDSMARSKARWKRMPPPAWDLGAPRSRAPSARRAACSSTIRSARPAIGCPCKPSPRAATLPRRSTCTSAPAQCSVTSSASRPAPPSTRSTQHCSAANGSTPDATEALTPTQANVVQPGTQKDRGKVRETRRPHHRSPRLKGVPMTAYRTIHVDGVEVFYREGGDPGAPPLLLLHGFPTSSTQYQELIDRLSDRFPLVAPDYPGFGYTEPLEGTTTFDRIADVVDGFVHALDLDHYGLYVFDFGAPVGFRLATRHPERVDALIIQNGNAYQAGIGPNLAGLAPYWEDRVAAEPAARAFLQLDATRAQYVEGVADPQSLDPDLWTLDQHFLDLPRRDQVMLDLFYDYTSNIALYPTWQTYLRDQQPATLVTWGANDRYFVANGARAYLADLPNAELHLLDTGHFALATHAQEIADLIAAFHAKRTAADPTTTGASS